MRRLWGGLSPRRNPTSKIPRDREKGGGGGQNSPAGEGQQSPLGFHWGVGGGGGGGLGVDSSAPRQARTTKEVERGSERDDAKMGGNEGARARLKISKHRQKRVVPRSKQKKTGA